MFSFLFLLTVVGDWDWICNSWLGRELSRRIIWSYFCRNFHSTPVFTIVGSSSRCYLSVLYIFLICGYFSIQGECWLHLCYRPHPKDGESNVFSLSTPRGVPISHNALQHYPEFHGADTWGGGTWPDPSRGGILPGGTLPGGYPAGGYPAQGGTLLGVPCQGGTLPGGTQLGQQKKYSLHGRWYASCVHAGGLSCWKDVQIALISIVFNE